MNKEQPEIKIYKIQIMVWGELREKVKEYTARDTGKIYIFDGNRLAKNKMMEIKTNLIENHQIISYFIYCLEDQQEEAMKMLKAHIFMIVKKYINELEQNWQLIKHYENDIKSTKLESSSEKQGGENE